MSPLSIQVLKSTGLVLLDLSVEENRQEVLRALENDGFIVLKRATTLDSGELARRNTYVITLLASTRNGRFLASQPVHKPYHSLPLVPTGRPQNWEELAAEREVVAITCYHLGGDENIRWTLEYDTGLRGPVTNSFATIEACGRDIIICNSWLARPLPKPNTEVDMIMVMHRWTDFNWVK